RAKSFNPLTPRPSPKPRRLPGTGTTAGGLCMRRLLIVLALLAALGTFVLLSGTAKVANANNAAIVIDNGGCTMLDTAGVNDVVAGADHTAATVKKGNITLKCYALVDNETGKVIKWNTTNTEGLLCGTLYGLTDRWFEVIDALGNATLTCQIKG